MRSTSGTRVLVQTPGERRCAAGILGDHEDRVVAGNRADDLGLAGSIDGECKRLRLSRSGANHEHLLRPIDPPQEFPSGALECVEDSVRTHRIDTGPLVRTVAGTLYEAELLDVARNGGLCRLEPRFVQAAAQLLLTVERLAV